MIPATLQESLLSRLDRLDAVKDVVQIGAAIGREFSRDLVTAASGLSEDEIGVALGKLEKAELVSRRGAARTSIYTFRHALILDAAYASLAASRRSTVHRDIADAILKTLPDLGTREPETLARHFQAAGLVEKAGEWWSQAGENALRRSAYVEARAHFERAIASLVTRDDMPSQMSALKLQVSLGQALLSIHGFAAPATVAAFERANELAGAIKDDQLRFGIFYGLWSGAVTSGTGAPMRKWAKSFLDQAQVQTQSPLPEFGVGHRITGNTHFFFGEFADARHHLESANALVRARSRSQDRVSLQCRTARCGEDQSRDDARAARRARRGPASRG